MKIHHVQRIWKRPFFANLKKHYCPTCRGKLNKVKVSKIVHCKSNEANEFDFKSAGGDGYMIGNVKFTWTEFFCSKCAINYPINHIYQVEKTAKKAKH